MKAIDKRKIIACAAAVAVTGGIFASTAAFSNAMTLDKAKSLAKEHVPSTAIFVKNDEEKTKFELEFYDSTQGATYDVEVSKDEERVMEVTMDKDSDLGGKSVKITEAQAKKLVTDEFTGAKVSNVYLNVDDNLYTYDVDFRSDDFYGDAELNAETGEMLESKIKYGQAVTIPVEGDNAKNTSSTSNTGLLTYEQAKTKASELNGGNTASTSNTGLLTYEQAKTKASELNGGNTAIKSCELDKDNGVFYYDVDFLNGSEVKLNAKTGELISKEPAKTTNNNQSSQNSQSANNNNQSSQSASKAPATTNSNSGSSNSSNNSGSSGKISEAKVREIVQAKVPGATILEIELDYDDGILVYEVESYKGVYEYDFEINAASGVILDFDKDHIYD